MAESAISVDRPFSIARTGIVSGGPLSFAQERLWFLDQLFPGGAAYNIPLVIDLAGPLDAGAFTRALVEIVRRHDALRTTFPSERGVPYQAVQPADRFSVPLTDLSALDAGRAEAEADGIVATESRRPFDLAKGPVFRATLLRLAPARHVLVACVHHIVYDAWSNAVVFRELTTLYRAFSRGEPSSLEEPPVRFIDFAVAQREHVRGEMLRREMDYWKRHLGAPARLALPTDRQRPAVQRFGGAREHLFLPEDLIAAMDGFSRREGVTLFISLLSAYAALLHLNCGQEVMVIGTPITNRTKRELESVVGFFLNTVPLCIDVSGHPAFRGLVQRVKQVAFSAYAHQQLPFEKLVHELRPERSLARTPIIDTVFVLDNSPGAVGETRTDGDLTLKRRVIDTGTSKFDIGLLIFRRDGGRRATLEYLTDLFDAGTASRLLDQYRRILEAALADPDAPLGELLPPTAEETLQITGEWSGRTAPYPRERTVSELVEANALQHPEAVAVIDAAAELTYATLNRRANQLAWRLRAAGIRHGARVGVCLDRSAETIVALLGILKAGAAYVPFDPSYPPDRLAWMARRVALDALVTRTALAGTLSLPAATVIALDREEAVIARQSQTNPDASVGAEALAYVLFTSGTTGDPKPVGVPHRAITRLAYGMPEIPVGGGSRVLHAAPLSFDASTFEIWVPLLRGGSVVISPYDLPTPLELEQVLTSHGVTVLWLTASLFNLIVDERPGALDSVQCVLTGGEALSVGHVERALAALPDAVIVNGYGPTETTTFATYHVIARDKRQRPSIPIGRPLDNSRVYVLDDELRPVAPGIPGELWIGGDGVSLGYLDDPVLTAARFRPDPFVGPPGRMYRSGDRARFLADGVLEFLGRVDDQLKIRGFRIEPGEVEAALMAHPDVERAAVAAHDLAATGPTLVAYVVARNATAPPAAAELRAFLRARVPEHLVPQFYEVLASLPLLPNGKIDRRALKPPSPRGASAKHGSDGPALTRTESLVADVWRTVLRVNDLDGGSNFFELGGDSLLAAQILSRLGNLTGVPLGVRALFEFPTLSGLSKILDSHLGGTTVPSHADLHPRDDRPALAVDATLAGTRAGPEPGHAALVPGAVESVVSEIWRGILDVAAIDPDDNFFELGGHSLLAVRVVAEVESRLGVTLSPVTLFQHGTIREQCRLILQRHQTIEWSPLVAIRHGGSKPPLFLVHAIGGEVLSYAPLAARLGDDQPVFGLRVRTENGVPVHSTVEKMAEYYIQAIGRVRPNGPYHIGGYSGGGLIAYEMARQLRRLGEEVALLAMIDCSAPGRPRPSLLSAAHWLQIPKKTAYWVMDDDFFRDGVSAAWGRVRSKVTWWRQARRVRHGAAAPEVDIRHALGLWRYPDASREFLAVLHRALRSYQPPPYAGSIAVIRARSRKLLARALPEPDLGWRRFVTGPVWTAVVAGAHDTIVREPRVRQLADVLTRLLAESASAPAN